MSTKTGKLAAAGLMTLLLCLSQFPVPVQAQGVALASGAVTVVGATTLSGGALVTRAISVAGATVVSGGSTLAAGTVVDSVPRSICWGVGRRVRSGCA
jgi:hypothetical protein